MVASMKRSIVTTMALVGLIAASSASASAASCPAAAQILVLGPLSWSGRGGSCSVAFDVAQAQLAAVSHFTRVKDIQFPVPVFVRSVRVRTEDKVGGGPLIAWIYKAKVTVQSARRGIVSFDLVAHPVRSRRPVIRFAWVAGFPGNPVPFPNER
jgi:hypothetical protein